MADKRPGRGRRPNPGKRIVVYFSEYLCVEYCKKSGTVYLFWYGDINDEIVRNEGTRILPILETLEATKIYNDNGSTAGNWGAASDWVANTWFPAVFEMGFFFFAWRLSGNYESKLSAQKSLPSNPFVKAFTSEKKAKLWLDSCSLDKWLMDQFSKALLKHPILTAELQRQYSYLFLIASIIFSGLSVGKGNVGKKRQLTKEVIAQRAAVREVLLDIATCDILIVLSIMSGTVKKSILEVRARLEEKLERLGAAGKEPTKAIRKKAYGRVQKLLDDFIDGF